MKLDIDTEVLAREFDQNGFAIIPGFYDVEHQVKPIVDAIAHIIGTLGRKYKVAMPEMTPEDMLAFGYSRLIHVNRAWGGEVYDAVKQVPAFMQLVADPRNSRLFEALRAGSLPGLAAGGYGIRIDNPNEDKFRAPWHQEFPAQLRSPDGIVFWSPLLAITKEMGPVTICPGSQAEGIIPVYEDDGGAGRTGAYSLELDRGAERIAKYQQIAPLTQPGDLVLMDFLTLHRSGENRSDRPRWSMQFRYFNFANPLGEKISWAGSFASGTDFRSVLPELAATSEDA